MDNYRSGLFQPSVFQLNDIRLNRLDNSDGLNIIVVAFVVFGWSLTLARNALFLSSGRRFYYIVHCCL